MRNFEPLVSVVIPTYKREENLKRALESVSNQSYDNIEIIIVDDSPDMKPQEFFKGYNFGIRYIHNKIRRGAPAARNQGVDKATGDFIAFLDDDDIWDERKIEWQIREFEEHPQASICITYSHDLRFAHDRINAPPPKVLHKELIKSFNLSSTSSYLVRAYALKLQKQKDGYIFDEDLLSGQEYDLAIRLTDKNHYVVCVQIPLITQYSGEGQISENWSRKISGIMQLYNKHHKEYEMIDHIKTLGLLGLFFMGFFIGNKIYNIIIPIKEMYENV